MGWNYLSIPTLQRLHLWSLDLPIYLSVCLSIYQSIYTGAQSRCWTLWPACARKGLVRFVERVLVRKREKKYGGVAGSESSGQMLDLAHLMFENIKWGSQSSIVRQSIPLLNCAEKEGSALDLVFRTGLDIVVRVGSPYGTCSLLQVWGRVESY